ncbi:hypothetical protein AAD018_015405 [Aestuariibius insulae]|uniref:hypothetical protein n=1 Tax=Aestuariibius insulae TaxID=2058287 RepID=UPI00345E1E4F
MQTLTVQFQISAPMEEALRLAAWEDDTSVADIMRQAIGRDIRRRKQMQQAALRRQLQKEDMTA